LNDKLLPNGGKVSK